MHDEPLTSRDELLSYFLNAYKEPHQWRMGAEFEKLGVEYHTGRAVPYEGPRGIETVLERLSSDFAWSPIREGNHILGLEKGSAHVSLEPGAQLELSSTPWHSLHEMAAELAAHIAELKLVGTEWGIRWLGLGIHPVSRWKDINVIPKQRYAIMTSYMPRKGDLGLAMMRETAAVQLNLDYKDEQDAMDKCRLSMLLSPFIMAMFANSPISEGTANGFVSKRVFIWQHTDPDRCGLIESLLKPDASFRDYVDFALSVPMYFIVRDGRWIEVGGARTFDQYLTTGFEGHRALWEDWVLHLNTIFTTVRFNPFLEIRGIDCPPPNLVMSVPALIKGILYNERAREDAWSVVSPLTSWSLEKLQHLYEEVSRKGPLARIGSIPLKDLFTDLVAIGKQGLKAQGVLDEQGRDEARYLDPLEEMLESGIWCPAFELLARWEGVWHKDIAKLIAHCEF